MTVTLTSPDGRGCGLVLQQRGTDGTGARRWQPEEELDLVRLDDQVVRLDPSRLGGGEADAVVAEGERVRAPGAGAGRPAAAWCDRAGPAPVLGPHDEAPGTNEPGRVEDAHPRIMPDAPTPTGDRRSDAGRTVRSAQPCDGAIVHSVGPVR